MLKLKLFSDSLELQASTISNQYPFVATITYAGRLSDGYVGGTEHIDGGPYRVLITAELLRKKIKSLAGKSVLVSDLEGHDRNYKIGTFLQAWVESADMPDGTTALAAKASGLLVETSDNKEIIEQIIDKARAEQLGFSYDIKNVTFDLKASTTGSSTGQYVEVTDFEWRGATILRRDAAAYEETRLAASKANPKTEEDDMTPEQIQAALAPLLSPIQSSISSIQTELASQKAELQSLKAAGTPKKEEPDGNSVGMKDFAAGIGSAIAEANKPVVEAIGKVLEAVTKRPDQTTGIRKTLAFTGADFQSKYRFGAADTDLSTVEGCEKLIDEIHASNLSASRKEQMLSPLGAQKRRLIRENLANGGVN